MKNLSIRAQDFEPKNVLQRELLRRCQVNPKYSLRAFAKALEMSPAALSLILAGKRRLSSKAGERVATKLSLSPKERAFFLNAPKSANGKDSSAANVQRLSLDAFNMIADWYHLAILSLLEIPGAQLTSKYMSAKLSIHEREAQDAIDRLKRLELVEQVRGRWKQKGTALRFDNTHSTAATLRFNQQLLLKAYQAIENEPFEQRAMSASVFEMNPALVPMVREELKEFRRKLAQRLKGAGEAERVYCLSLQIFPLSKGE